MHDATGPTTEQLRQCTQLLQTTAVGDPGELSIDPREQHLLLSALVLAAAEHNMALCDHHAARAGLDDAVQIGAKLIMALYESDGPMLVGYLYWRYQRDAIILSHTTLREPLSASQAASPADELLLAAAAAAARSVAGLLTLLNSRLREREQPGSTFELSDEALLRDAHKEFEQAGVHLGQVEAALDAERDSGPLME